MMKGEDFRADVLRFVNLVEDFVMTGFTADRELVGEQEHDGAQSVPEVSVTPQARAALLEGVAAAVTACTRCGLYMNRIHPVPGEGVLEPLVLVVGEAPGEEEDKSGRPFVGRAGQYLDKWLKAIKLDRSTNCYITNIVKSRPPGNRDPKPEEVAACMPFLDRQIEILRPQAILTVGRIASQLLTGQSSGIGALRGKVFGYRGIPLVPTYHPSAVLRDPLLRPAVWEDLKLFRARVLDHG